MPKRIETGIPREITTLPNRLLSAVHLNIKRKETFTLAPRSATRKAAASSVVTRLRSRSETIPVFKEKTEGKENEQINSVRCGIVDVRKKNKKEPGRLQRPNVT